MKHSKYYLGAAVMLFLIFFSGVIATYVISGLLLFAGLVALCESVKPIKWLLSKTGNILDILIFGFSIYAMSSMGVTVAIGLGVAGLLFSVYYKPILLRKNKPSKSSADKSSMESRKQLWEQ
tara:strand:+ start:1977 stop:2342 length:366 start_codon:yes stop_codon:yes gene_type:complete